MNRCMVVISQHHSMFEIDSNLDITNLKIVNFLSEQNPAPILGIYIWYSELFEIVNKKCMTYLFAISRFECTKYSLSSILYVTSMYLVNCKQHLLLSLWASFIQFFCLFYEVSGGRKFMKGKNSYLFLCGYILLHFCLVTWVLYEMQYYIIL